MANKNSSMAYKLTVPAIVLMIFTSVYGFVNISRAFYLMGYSAIFWYLLAAAVFLLPYAMMMAEYGTAFSKEKGGIYSWMEKSVGPRYAFVGMFMVYISYMVWTVATASYMWIPLSTMISGFDNTQSWVIAGLTYSQVLGLLAILWVLILTFVATRGVHFVSRIASVGGLAVMALNLVLILGAVFILFLNGFAFAQPIEGISSFFVSPNMDFTSFFAVLGFAVFAIYAYGGTETTGGLVDKMDEPRKNFPKALFTAVIMLGIGYAVGIFLVGAFVNWDTVFAENSQVNMGNVVYVVMNQLGLQLGEALNMSPESALGIGVFLARLTAFCMFLSYIGAFFTFIYAPIKQLIEGTPKEIWPASWTKDNGNHMPVRAMWVQGIAIIVLIFIVTFGGKTATEFFDRIVSLANVAMTLPYAFLAFAFIFFKLNDKIEKPFVIIPNKTLGIIAAISATFAILFVNLFTMISPIVTKGDWVSTAWMVGEPIVFGLIALAVYQSYEYRKNKK